MVIKDGRFGPYVTDGETNASLRKGDEVLTITDDRASELLAERRARGPVKRTTTKVVRKKTAAKKTAAKKTAAKKQADKKVAANEKADKKAKEPAKKFGLFKKKEQPVEVSAKLAPGEVVARTRPKFFFGLFDAPKPEDEALSPEQSEYDLKLASVPEKKKFKVKEVSYQRKKDQRSGIKL